jgi:hypothetical protein
MRSKTLKFVRRFVRYQKVNRRQKSLRKYSPDEPLIGISGLRSCLSTYNLDIEEIIAEGDLVSIRGFFSGTHLGPFMGAPATGKTFRSPLFVTYRIAAGKIVEHWMMIDEADLLRQLGITQTQAQGS